MVWRAQWRSIEQQCYGEGLPRALSRRACACNLLRESRRRERHIYALARIERVQSFVFCIVSFVFVALIVVMSLHTVAAVVVDGTQCIACG